MTTPAKKTHRRFDKVRTAALWALVLAVAVFPLPWWP